MEATKESGNVYAKYVQPGLWFACKDKVDAQGNISVWSYEKRFATREEAQAFAVSLNTDKE